MLATLASVPAGSDARLSYVPHSRRPNGMPHEVKIKWLGVDVGANVVRFTCSIGGRGEKTFAVPIDDVGKPWRADGTWHLRVSGYLDADAGAPYRYVPGSHVAVYVENTPARDVGANSQFTLIGSFTLDLTNPGPIRAKVVDESNRLYAHLYGVHADHRYAAYVTATAYARFDRANLPSANRAELEQVEAAYARVRAHLGNPASPLEIPDDDAVCKFARDAGPNVGNPLWLKL